MLCFDVRVKWQKRSGPSTSESGRWEVTFHFKSIPDLLQVVKLKLPEVHLCCGGWLSDLKSGQSLVSWEIFLEECN